MSAHEPAAGGDPSADRPGRPPASTWPARAGALAGGAIVAYGLAGLARHAASTRPGWWAVWLLAGLGAHDLLLVPALLVAGWLTGRLPSAWRPAVRAALLVSGTLILVTLPALLGGGRATQPGNTSVMPNDYPLSLALVVALVWAVALLAALTRRLRPTRRAGATSGQAERNERGQTADRTLGHGSPIEVGRRGGTRRNGP